MSTYADTSGIISVLNTDDPQHAVALEAWSGLVEAREDIVTTSYTLVETFALVQARLGLAAARALAVDMMPVVRVIWVDADLHHAALAALLTAGRRQLSLVDCVSFEAMRRLEIRCAFTFDRHFLEQGFEVVP